MAIIKYFRNLWMCSIWLLFVSLSTAMADKIQDYHVDITILENGRIDVVETIKIETKLEEIRLGITREIPINYALGKKEVYTPVKIISVTRNGKPENYWTVRRSNNLQILTGEEKNLAEYFLAFGEHTYQIHWQSENHIRKFGEYDEIYINAIGTNWRLPIDKASATIFLPDSVEEIQSAGYFGKGGSTARAKVEVVSPTEIRFTAPRSLSRYEGLTVSTGFTPGKVAGVERDWTTKLLESIQNALPFQLSLTPIFMLGASIVLFLYWCVGCIIFRIITPKSHRTFNVRFTPPNFPLEKIIGLFPSKKQNDTQYLLAVLVELIRRNIIKITPENKRIILTGEGDFSDLSQSEKDVVSTMEEQGGQIYYHRYNAGIEAMRNKALSPIHALMRKFYRSPMTLFKWTAFFLIVGYCVVFSEAISVITYFFLIFMIVGIGVFLTGVLLFLKALYSGKFSEIFGAIFQTPMLLLFGSVFTLIPITWAPDILFGLPQRGITDQLILNGAVMIASIVLLSSVCSLYSRFGKTIRTEYVDEQQDVLEFEHFLRYTKKEEYTILRPEIFEEYLAYAIIFNLEKKWLALFKEKYPEAYEASRRTGSIASVAVMSSSSFSRSMSAPKSSGSSSGRSGGAGRSSGGSRGGGSSGGGSGGGGGGGR
ncbi:DUF2207 domain-containing protein [Ignatzschineria sp. LJL83]